MVFQKSDPDENYSGKYLLTSPNGSDIKDAAIYFVLT